MTKIVILSVPYVEPYPAMAPILLSACLNNAGIDAIGIDFSIKFIENFAKKPYWTEIKNILCNGYLHPDLRLQRRTLIDILKFTKSFLIDVKIKYNPEWLGLSIFTNESLDFSFVLSYLIRKYLPSVKIIAGGKGIEVASTIEHTSEKHYEVFINQGLVDAVIVGDAEESIIDVIKNNKSGIIYSKPQTASDLDKIPLPQWNQYDLKIYSELAQHRDSDMKYDEPYFIVTSSKGCVRNCTFCDVASFWPKFIYRNPENVAQEIITTYKNTGIKKLRFTDNLINGSVSNYRKINEILVAEIPGEVEYDGYAIFRGKDQLPQSDFDLAAAAGCKMWNVGVESGSEKIRFDMGKKFTDEDLDWSVKNLHRVGIKQVWLLIVGYPSETDHDFDLTLKMLEKYAPLAANKMIQIGVTPTFALLDNSPIFNNKALIEKYGLRHNIGQPMYQKFWTSSINKENTFGVRAKRWHKLIETTEKLGYAKQYGFPIEKWRDEVINLEKIWHDSQSKNNS